MYVWSTAIQNDIVWQSSSFRSESKIVFSFDGAEMDNFHSFCIHAPTSVDTNTHTRARSVFNFSWYLTSLCSLHLTHFIVFVFYLSLFHSIRFALFILFLHTSPLFTLLVPPSSHAVYSRFHFIFYSFFFFSFIHDDHSLVICCVQSVRCYVRRCMPIVRFFLMSA